MQQCTSVSKGRLFIMEGFQMFVFVIYSAKEEKKSHFWPHGCHNLPKCYRRAKHNYWKPKVINPFSDHCVDSCHIKFGGLRCEAVKLQSAVKRRYYCLGKYNQTEDSHTQKHWTWFLQSGVLLSHRTKQTRTETVSEFSPHRNPEATFQKTSVRSKHAAHP